MSVTFSGVTHRSWFDFGEISFEISFGIYMTIPLVKHGGWTPACTLNFSSLWRTNRAKSQIIVWLPVDYIFI